MDRNVMDKSATGRNATGRGAETASETRTLFISDLDGTLLNGESRISDETRRLINEAVKNGALFSIATARTPATVSTLLEGMDLRLPMVVMTGAALWDMRANKYSNVRFHSPETARRLIEIYREAKLPTFIYALGEDHIIHIYHLGKMDSLARRFMEERIDNPFKTFHVNEEGESESLPPLDRVLLFLTMQPTEAARRVYDEVCQKVACRPIFYHDMYGDEIAELEVFAPDASKAVGVREIAALADADRIVAFGDNVNDLPMLKAAAHGVAVGNAVAEVREVADEVIGNNTDDAVARYVFEATKQH